jgi:hypothetical protein
VSTSFWVGLPVQVSFAAMTTFWVFHNGWDTFVVSVGLQLSWWIFLGRKGWV